MQGSFSLPAMGLVFEKSQKDSKTVKKINSLTTPRANTFIKKIGRVDNFAVKFRSLH